VYERERERERETGSETERTVTKHEKKVNDVWTLGVYVIQATTIILVHMVNGIRSNEINRKCIKSCDTLENTG
jgi:hypothetical protein